MFIDFIKQEEWEERDANSNQHIRWWND
jgi:hypothetical protein